MRKKWTVGIDEVGRGPLAGPLTVAAVAAPVNYKLQTINNKQIKKFSMLENIKNSKKLSSTKREAWNEKIRGNFMYAISSVGPTVIDRIGISKAARLAVSRCLKKITGSRKLESARRLGGAESCAIVLDGGLYAPITYPYQQTIIKGDEKHPLIAAASIVAKVHRDAFMRRLHKKVPLYGFDQHKGYGTALHRAILKAHGLSSVHRRSFCANINAW